VGNPPEGSNVGSAERWAAERMGVPVTYVRDDATGRLVDAIDFGVVPVAIRPEVVAGVSALRAWSEGVDDDDLVPVLVVPSEQHASGFVGSGAVGFGLAGRDSVGGYPDRR
jgi:hypothetical protein